MDKQQTIIEKGDTQALLSHVELEEQILAEIFAIQKTMDPMEELYRTVALTSEKGDGEIAELKSTLEGLKQEAAARSERNKDLLSKRMAEIQGELKGLRGNPYAARPSIYSGDAPSMIDLKG
ncbi:flagellar biosynthesis protein FlgN [Treponema primitia]|nr:flagellar biosynthesis protein FlgN [Treponema primitia]